MGSGNDDENALSCAEVFDPQTQTWAPIASMSTERGSFAVAAVQGKLYAMGGSAAGFGAVATAEAYDPQQNRWEAVAPMAQARDSFAVAVI